MELNQLIAQRLTKRKLGESKSHSGYRDFRGVKLPLEWSDDEHTYKVIRSMPGRYVLEIDGESAAWAQSLYDIDDTLIKYGSGIPGTYRESKDITEAAPARNDSSSTGEKVRYCNNLIAEARDTGDADIAWELIDFLHDSDLLGTLYKVTSTYSADKEYSLNAQLNSIASKLKVEYRDFLDAEDMEMSIDLGENMRDQIRNIFRILKKNGMILESTDLREWRDSNVYVIKYKDYDYGTTPFIKAIQTNSLKQAIDSVKVHGKDVVLLGYSIVDNFKEIPKEYISESKQVKESVNLAGITLRRGSTFGTGSESCEILDIYCIGSLHDLDTYFTCRWHTGKISENVSLRSIEAMLAHEDTSMIHNQENN